MNASTYSTRITRALCGVTLAIGLLSASTASAAVGYVNVLLPTGYSLVNNPLFNPANTIPDLFGGSIGNPSGAGGTVSKWLGSGYGTLESFSGIWFGDIPNSTTLAVGEGAVVYNPGPAIINTFVGEVQGVSFTNDSPTRLPVSTSAPGIYLRGSIAPFSQNFFADIMGRAPQNGDAVLKLDPAGNPLFSKFLGGVWHDPSGGNDAPILVAGEAAFFDTTGNQFAGFTLPTGVVVPEPASMAIVGLGLIGTAFYRRSKRG